MTLRDKVRGERIIPLTPIVAHLLARLLRCNTWIFAIGTSAARHLTEPNHPHTSACKFADIDRLTLHGLRRLLRHEKIEAWILEQAGIVFDVMAAPGVLRVVKAS